MHSKHIFCEAFRHGIENPKKLTAEQCTQGVAVCRKLLKEHKDNTAHLRREHLGNRYELASDLKNPVKCTQTKEIIKWEEQRNDWQRIQQTTGYSRTGTMNLVQRQEGDKIIKILKEGAMVREIQNVTEKRFKLTNSTHQ